MSGSQIYGVVGGVIGAMIPGVGFYLGAAHGQPLVGASLGLQSDADKFEAAATEPAPAVEEPPR